MSFSYPGDNLHLENHSLGEESFWPSFTDIMMVIVMVFLLVTISVILNNWTLIANLKESISAQQVASNMAVQTKMQNLGLDARLTVVKKELAKSQQLSKSEHQKLLDTLAKLAKTEQAVESLSATAEQQKSQLAALQKTLQEKQQAFSLLTSQQAEKTEELDRLKNESATRIAALNMLQTDRTKQETNLSELQKQHKLIQTQYQAVQLALTKATETLASSKINRNDTQAKLQLLETEKQEQAEALKRQEEEQQRVLAKIKAENEKQLTSLKTKTTESDSQLSQLKKQLAEKDQMLVALQKERANGESQLLSLKGDYDSLDTKYQKLLRPARSSKDKHIVTVTYKKISGKKTIRLKTSANGSYKTVSSKELHKALKKIKKKYKKDLYVKIIIPDNSGLSYNEAWRFTSGLQKKYDYYFQSDESKPATKTSKKKNAKK